MGLTVYNWRIFLIFTLQFIVNNATVEKKKEVKYLMDTINYININSKINLNLIINPPKNIGMGEEAFWNGSDENPKVPKLILSNVTSYDTNVKPVFGNHNKEILTIIWFSENHINETFALLERLLYKIHYKDIILVHQGDTLDRAGLDENLLMLIFQKCWSSGFVSVLLWSQQQQQQQQQLYTYHPYPSIKIVYLESVDQFMDKSHLNNFQQYSWRVPFLDQPNQCYSYTNHQGKLIRTGYFYKWIQLYFEYYNGTIDHVIGDMWSGNGTLLDGINALLEANVSILPFHIRNLYDIFDMSQVIYLSKVTLMVPNSKEVSRSLYPILPFSGFIWFVIVLSGVMIFIVLYFLQRIRNVVKDLSKLALESFGVLLFLSCGLERKTLKDFLIHLLFLFTGIFLTTYYSTSLSSYLTSREYEPPLRYLNDIARTDLTVLEYSGDIAFMLEIDIPKVVKDRMRTGNNFLMFQNRQKLNMTHMYRMHEEYMDYILFQQYYLKHPIARKLDQEMYYRPVFVSIMHRTPFIDHFNKYLLRIQENGLMQKFLFDTKWDGVVSGNIKIMLDPDDKQPLGMEYLYYVFVIWICGLLLASVVFIFECKVRKLNCRQQLEEVEDI